MTLPIDSMNLIRMVAVATTPPEYTGYTNLVVALKPTDLGSMGSGSDNPGSLLGVKGFPMSAGVAETRPGVLTWFVMTKLDQLTAAYLAGLRAWIKPASLASVKTAAQNLIDQGAAASDVRAAFGVVVNAVISDMNP